MNTLSFRLSQGSYDLDFKKPTSPLQALESAILICLFSDQKGSLESLGDSQICGWWADLLSSESPLGSKLWLLDQGKKEISLLEKAKSLAHEALTPLLKIGAIAELQVDAFFQEEKLLIQIALTLPTSKSHHVRVVI